MRNQRKQSRVPYKKDLKKRGKYTRSIRTDSKHISSMKVSATKDQARKSRSQRKGTTQKTQLTPDGKDAKEN